MPYEYPTATAAQSALCPDSLLNAVGRVHQLSYELRHLFVPPSDMKSAPPPRPFQNDFTSAIEGEVGRIQEIHDNLIFLRAQILSIAENLGLTGKLDSKPTAGR